MWSAVLLVLYAVLMVLVVISHRRAVNAAWQNGALEGLIAIVEPTHEKSQRALKFFEESGVWPPPPDYWVTILANHVKAGIAGDVSISEPTAEPLLTPEEILTEMNKLDTADEVLGSMSFMDVVRLINELNTRVAALEGAKPAQPCSQAKDPFRYVSGEDPWVGDTVQRVSDPVMELPVGATIEVKDLCRTMGFMLLVDNKGRHWDADRFQLLRRGPFAPDNETALNAKITEVQALNTELQWQLQTARAYRAYYLNILLEVTDELDKRYGGSGKTAIGSPDNPLRCVQERVKLAVSESNLLAPKGGKPRRKKS